MPPRRLVYPALAALAATLALAQPAAAHPHVWVTTKTDIAFDSAGRVSALRHAWTFDEGYTSFLVQGLDANGDGAYSSEELAELAELNATSLADFEYFTYLKADGAGQIFAPPVDYRLTHDGAHATLHFTLPLETPAEAEAALVLEVYDPTFFVSFRMDESDDAVALAGGPEGCAIDVARATEVRLDQFQNLSEAFFEAMTAPDTLGVEIVNRALVACP
ncbi:DUF1007 family protein [Salinarimonas ramus]|uniref:ABC transporter substrate-binding protein n=1 Tax=Salinarimonas ramus TaxID=690164 RepID=A0A917Q6U1_9HYPH|nr:DUF1007 family protein [Salinarimonas ramus]GGK29340.1 ABC transporter substrate-binding protein [Salinarimonas ramus]